MWYYNKCKEEVTKMTKQQLLEDLFMAVRHTLMGKDVQSTIANVVASKVVKGAECANIEDIKKLRDIFLQ